MNRLSINAIDFAQYCLELVNCKIIRAIGGTITQEAADYTGTSLNTAPTTTTGVGGDTQMINGYRLVGDGSWQCIPNDEERNSTRLGRGDVI
jgi:hypothetical protein